MKKNVLMILLGLVCIGLSLAVGYGTGVTHERSSASQAVRKDFGKQKQVSKVAIVNMDEGVRKESGVVNYGTTMLSSIPIDYVVTGLEDARSGLLTSKYHSYIIIPTTFSQSVESINGQP